MFYVCKLTVRTRTILLPLVTATRIVAAAVAATTVVVVPLVVTTTMSLFVVTKLDLRGGNCLNHHSLE